VDEIKSYIDEAKMVLIESRSDFDLAYAIYRKLITDASTMTQIVINQIEQSDFKIALPECVSL
jgi:hypothetical protein